MATQIPWHTRARISGVPLGGGAEVGIEEAHEYPDKKTRKPGWTGNVMLFGPKDRRLAVINLSCKDRMPPAWEHLRAGQPVLYQSIHFDAAAIPAGLDNVVLRYSPAPDPKLPSGYAVIAIRCDTNRRVPCTVVGKTVTITPIPGVDVSVQYRPIYPCKLVSIDPGTMSEIDGRQNWGMSLAVLV